LGGSGIEWRWPIGALNHEHAINIGRATLVANGETVTAISAEPLSVTQEIAASR
jgi:hypothetical protein